MYITEPQQKTEIQTKARIISKMIRDFEIETQTKPLTDDALFAIGAQLLWFGQFFTEQTIHTLEPASPKAAAILNQLKQRILNPNF